MPSSGHRIRYRESAVTRNVILQARLAVGRLLLPWHIRIVLPVFDVSSIMPRKSPRTVQHMQKVGVGRGPEAHSKGVRAKPSMAD